jgi:hypothetical protein
MNIFSEKLAYWYLRLNGFLTIPNFVVHPDQGPNQETDVDIIGVRFPYREENLLDPMKDADVFCRYPDKILIVITEVKNSICVLNGPWTKPERQNMLRVLCAMGTFSRSEAILAAKSIYEVGQYSSDQFHVTLLCLGGEMNLEVKRKYPKVPQILWPEVLGFIYQRFKDYKRQKTSHPQWDEQGKELWRTFEGSKDLALFKNSVSIS